MMEINKISNVSTEQPVEFVLKGIPSSPGISFARAYIIKPETFVVPDDFIDSKSIPKEIERFDTVIEEMVSELYSLLNRLKHDSKNVYAVIETNLLILTDSFFLESIKSRIRSLLSVENSVIQEFDQRKQMMKQSKDLILQERAVELEHIKERILKILRKHEITYNIAQNSVIVAQSVSPADVIYFRDAGVSGIITELGGISSHSSILARSFEIPEIISVKDATQLIPDNIEIIIDGYSGIITINPLPSTIADNRQRKAREYKEKRKLGKIVKLSSKTTDGSEIRLLANINSSEDIETSLMVGSEGIGLVRTEHLIMKLGYFPTEDDQTDWYSNIAQQVYPNAVTFRAFDIGSDKHAEGMPHHESNPALGFRGIRFLLHRRDIFVSQIIAVLRASENRNVRFMLPMITTVNELMQARNLLEECKQHLTEKNIPFDPELPIGIMVETPAAAIQSQLFAEYSDFFSIGTNDLTQYTLAADRTNEYVAELFDSFHPAVLKLIKTTVESAASKNIDASICGELAGHAAATSLLIGLGVKELSVSPGIIPELKNRIRKISFEESKLLAGEVLNCRTYNEVRKILGIAS